VIFLWVSGWAAEQSLGGISRAWLLGGGSLGAPKMAGRWGWPWRDVLGDDAVAVAHDAAAADFEDCR
jgi:hypothetical protein